MNWQAGSHYTTRDGFHVEIIKVTPTFKYKIVGVFMIRNVKFRVFFDGEGREFFGEKALDLMRLIPGKFQEMEVNR